MLGINNRLANAFLGPEEQTHKEPSLLPFFLFTPMKRSMNKNRKIVQKTSPFRLLIMNKYGYVFVWIRFEDSLCLSIKVVFDRLMERLNSDV